MNLRYALDTSIVSAPTWPRPPEGLVERLDAERDACAVPVPVWHELRFGVARMASSRRRTALERYLADVVLVAYPILPYDRAAAEWHAAERARLERAGRSAPFVDGAVAAIAAATGLVLVTANVRHFAGFRDLRVENWLEA